MGELWGIYCEDLREHWQHYNGTALCYVDEQMVLFLLWCNVHFGEDSIPWDDQLPSRQKLHTLHGIHFARDTPRVDFAGNGPSIRTCLTDIFHRVMMPNTFCGIEITIFFPTTYTFRCISGISQFWRIWIHNKLQSYIVYFTWIIV